MKPASSYQSPSMTPPDEPDLGDDECSIDGCIYLVLLDRDLCEEHTIESDMMFHDCPNCGGHEKEEA